jgi:hypothetical protein
MGQGVNLSYLSIIFATDPYGSRVSTRRLEGRQHNNRSTQGGCLGRSRKLCPGCSSSLRDLDPRWRTGNCHRSWLLFIFHSRCVIYRANGRGFSGQAGRPRTLTSGRACMAKPASSAVPRAPGTPTHIYERPEGNQGPFECRVNMGTGVYKS